MHLYLIWHYIYNTGYLVSVTHRYKQKIQYQTRIMMKKALGRRKHCALAIYVVRRSQKNLPAADPLPGGAGRPKFNQL